MKGKIYSVLLFIILSSGYLISLYYIQIGSILSYFRRFFIFELLDIKNIFKYLFSLNSNIYMIQFEILVTLLYLVGIFLLFYAKKIVLKIVFITLAILGFGGSVLLLQAVIVERGYLPCSTIIYKCSEGEQFELNTQGYRVRIINHYDHKGRLLSDNSFSCAVPDYFDAYWSAIKEVASWELVSNEIIYKYQFEEDESEITLNAQTRQIINNDLSNEVSSKINNKMYEGTKCF